MSDFSTAAPARLATVFCTVLYVDAASGLLRHGASETSPANAVFVADPTSTGPHRRGRLMFDAGGSQEPVVCRDDGCRPASSLGGDRNSADATLLELVPLERGLMGLRAEGFFLSAEPTGEISLSRRWCSTWECFLASENWCTDFGTKGEERFADCR
jgi:hypothetical protein